jgi:hypothetical protein
MFPQIGPIHHFAALIVTKRAGIASSEVSQVAQEK